LFVGEISKKKYADQIERSIESHSDSFHEVLNSAFGAAAAGQLVDSISSHGIVELARMQPIARRTVSRRIWRHPMRAIKDKIHLAKFSISRVASPPGPFVCILGIDGSGKSTVSDIIADQLKSSFSPVKQLHLRPRFLPELHKVAFWRSCTSVSEPISGRVPSGMGSLVRWFYYYVDYLIGYQFRVRPTLARKGIAIADRYFYDFRFDHAQKMVRLPESLIVFTQRFLPSPDAVVHIRVPSEIATKRRQGEISAEEADRQLVRIDQIVGEMDNGYVIVNDRSPTKAADSVIRLLFQELADSRLSR
jgi:thymidylate kinase